MKQDYENNKNKCTEYILQKVLEVPLEIKPAAMQVIQRAREYSSNRSFLTHYYQGNSSYLGRCL